jgi:hypothetical protein
LGIELSGYMEFIFFDPQNRLDFLRRPTERSL